MLVNVISLNIGGLKVSPEISLPPRLAEGDLPDVLAEFSQENGGSGSFIKKQYLEGMREVAHESINPFNTSQNIITNIYLNDTVDDLQDVEKGTIPIPIKNSAKGSTLFAGQTIASRIPGARVGFSKGAVWIKLTFEKQSILFINMHLPVKTSANDLGLAFREKMFIYLLSQIKNRTHINNNTHVIVSGDLNFRMNTDGDDQLTDLLKYSDDLPIPLEELTFPAGSSAKYTCKFKELSSNNKRSSMKFLTHRKCRIQPVSSSIDRSCFVDERIPSRCDRILAYGPTMKVLTYDAAPFVGSDHNMVIGSILLSSRSSQEGGEKTRKVRWALRKKATRRSKR